MGAPGTDGWSTPLIMQHKLKCHHRKRIPLLIVLSISLRTLEEGWMEGNVKAIMITTAPCSFNYSLIVEEILRGILGQVSYLFLLVINPAL